MTTRGRVLSVCAMLLVVTLIPTAAVAQEIALTYGRLLGDDLLDRAPLLGSDAPSDFSDAPIWR